MSCSGGTALFPASLTLHEIAPRAEEKASATVRESKLIGSNCCGRGTTKCLAEDELETTSSVQILNAKKKKKR